MVKLFNLHTQSEHADALADYLPNDRMFEAKKIEGKKLRQLLLGLGVQLLLAEEQLELLWEEFDPTITTLLIEEWESVVGIPDECFFGDRSLEDRRRDILIKLNSSVQTAEDFEDLAALLGINVTIKSGIIGSVFPLVFPTLFFGSAKEARFSMVVEITDILSGAFPYTFTFTFQNSVLETLKCLFNKLKPANTQVIFKQV